MDEAHMKGKETRQRLQAARDGLYREQLQATRAARTALQRVFESEDLGANFGGGTAVGGDWALNP